MMTAFGTQATYVGCAPGEVRAPGTRAEFDPGCPGSKPGLGQAPQDQASETAIAAERTRTMVESQRWKSFREWEGWKSVASVVISIGITYYLFGKEGLRGVSSGETFRTADGGTVRIGGADQPATQRKQNVRLKPAEAIALVGAFTGFFYLMHKYGPGSSTKPRSDGMKAP